MGAYIVLLPKEYQFKIGDVCADHWDKAHPSWVLGYNPWPPAADTVTVQGVANRA
jgi:hypothetical protein